MKTRLFLILPLILSCTNCTAELQSWSFVQSVGGVSIEEPYEEHDAFYLPIKVDVSGLQEITHKPTMLNSALMCSRTGHAIIGNEVHISIYTSVVNDTAGTNCKRIPLLGIKDGEYSVFYKTEIDGKHLLGNITIGSNKQRNSDSGANAPPPVR